MGARSSPGVWVGVLRLSSMAALGHFSVLWSCFLRTGLCVIPTHPLNTPPGASSSLLTSCRLGAHTQQHLGSERDPEGTGVEGGGEATGE